MRLGRALLVQRGPRGGGVPDISVGELPHPVPNEAEVLVRVQAAALTPTDVVMFTDLHAPLDDLLLRSLPVSSSQQQQEQQQQQHGGLQFPRQPAAQSSSSCCIVPGIFFFGQVLQLGPFVEGLNVGEPVLGIAPSGPISNCRGGEGECGAAAGDGDNPPQAVGGRLAPEKIRPWGCYREVVCVHFSSLLPVSELATNVHMPSLVAQVPPMVSALLCVASHLRLRQRESVLVVVPRLADVAFLLQRLLLLSDAWAGPLYLVVLRGRAPTRADLERHPLLRPLLFPLTCKTGSSQTPAPGAPSTLNAGSGAGGEREIPATFLDDFVGQSVEEHLQQRSAVRFAPAASVADGLRDVVGRVLDSTSGLGVDVILTLGVDLALPPPPPPPPEECVPPEAGAESAASPSFVSKPELCRPPTLLRTLVGALGLRGRLVTDCPRLEIMPAEGENLWAKECSVSFYNPHCLSLSAAQRGMNLHAIAEVVGRVACSEIPVLEAEVTQYRLFEQFSNALEAIRGSAGGAASLQQLAVLVI